MYISFKTLLNQIILSDYYLVKNGDDYLDSDIIIKLIVLFVLIVLSAFFSSAETALTTVNKIRIKSLADDGNKQAATVLKIIEHSGKMLSAILIGNNIVNLSASSLATTISLEVFGNVGVGISTGILTVVILVFSEISPKTIATIKSETISLHYSSIIYFLIKILTPIIYIINMFSNGFLHLFKIDNKNSTNSITESELRTIVGVSKDDGVIENEECKMIYNVFDFGDSLAKDIMVPRIDMTLVNINSGYEDLLEIYRQDMFTRYPVYEETTDNIVGFINIKDLLLYNNSTDNFDIKNILRDPYFTYEFKNTAELLMEMKESSINTAIVLDEYGATAGLITLEDLLEEIVGEIRDEYDEDESEPFIILAQGEYIADGSMKLDDIKEELDIDITSSDYDSLAGYLLEKLDHLPHEGEHYINSNNIYFRIEKMDKKRIEKIYMKIPEKFI